MASLCPIERRNARPFVSLFAPCTVSLAKSSRIATWPGADAGIVLTNAVGQRWLSYEQLRQCRDDLILVHIGGRSDGQPAVDYTVNCEVGLPLITGPRDFEPRYLGATKAAAIMTREQGKRRAKPSPSPRAPEDAGGETP